MISVDFCADGSLLFAIQSHCESCQGCWSPAAQVLGQIKTLAVLAMSALFFGNDFSWKAGFGVALALAGVIDFGPLAAARSGDSGSGDSYGSLTDDAELAAPPAHSPPSPPPAEPSEEGPLVSLALALIQFYKREYPSVNNSPPTPRTVSFVWAFLWWR